MIKKGCGCNKKQPETVIIDPVPEWEPVNPCPENTQVRIENHPDEEDLTEVLCGEELVLKFKDKVYNPMTYSGYGRVFLRKNMQPSQEECPGEMNVLTQSMFMDATGQLAEHTIFIVQYDYDLNGKFITMPQDSILLFLGGSFKNGTLVLNRTLILPQALPYNTYIKCTVTGPYMNGQMFYNEDGLRIWNGTEWVVLDGTGTIDLQALVHQLNQQVQQLVSNVTNVQEALDTKSNVGHTHAIANVTGLQSTLDSLQDSKLTAGTIRINGTVLRDNVDINIEAGSGGGSGSSTYTLPVATKNVLGGIKVGYQKYQNNVPVVLDSYNRAYVTLEKYDDTGINNRLRLVEGEVTRISTIEQSVENVRIAVEAISKLEDGSSIVDALAEMRAYVTEQLEPVIELSATVSNLNEQVETIQTNQSKFLLTASLEQAVADLLVTSSSADNDVVARIRLIADQQNSQITLSADRINFNSSYLNIEKREGDSNEPILKVKTAIDANTSNYTYIKPSEIHLQSRFDERDQMVNNNQRDAILTPTELSFKSASGGESKVTASLISLTNGGLYNQSDYPVTLSGLGLKILYQGNSFVQGGGEAVQHNDKVELTASKLQFNDIENNKTLTLGINQNYTGTFTVDNQTITVQDGIITKITTN